MANPGSLKVESYLVAHLTFVDQTFHTKPYTTYNIR